MKNHKHESKHFPTTGTGFAVCKCGATIRVEKAKIVGTWHSCSLCVAGTIGVDMKEVS